MSDIVKSAFAALESWPLVQGAVAILVLVIAALLAWATLRKQMPASSAGATAAPTASPVPIQIESPWLVQHLVEMHLDIEKIKNALAAQESHQRVLGSKIDGIASLLKRRQSRRDRGSKA
jgi:hypothetical protein